MKPSSYSPVLSSLLLAGAAFLVTAAPTTKSLNARDDDWTFSPCSKTGPGFCTVYIATSDPDVIDYRTAGLYDSNCNILQAVKGSKTTPKLTLKGTLANYVDIYVDQDQHPNGYISYLGMDVPLGNQDTTGNPMACFKPPNSDGVGCRKAFACS